MSRRDPTEAISPQITVSLTRARDVPKFVLAMQVGNADDGRNGIVVIAVEHVGTVWGAYSPPEWMSFGSFDGRDSLVGWACTDTLTKSPQGWHGNLYPSPFMVQPGDTMRWYAAYLDAVPKRLRFYAQGFDTIPGPRSDVKTIFDHGWTGEIAIELDGVPDDKATLIDLAGPGSKSEPFLTSVAFSLPKEAGVNCYVHGSTGKPVRTLMARRVEAGEYIVTWDGRDDSGLPQPAGIYSVQLNVDGRKIGARRVAIRRPRRGPKPTEP